MDKLLKVKKIIEKKINKNRQDIQDSIEGIAKVNRWLHRTDITVSKYMSGKAEIRVHEKRFDEASTHNKVLTDVLYIIDNVIHEKGEE